MDSDWEGLPALRAARPVESDVVARRLEAQVRERVAGVPTKPIHIDRFVVLERLGAGATGVVFAAFDPRLDRKIALKLVRADGAAARDRVLAEARAMAKLSDSNVVAVYDAADCEGELYIAMELVAGCNLRRWLAIEPREVAEIIEVFVKAGRGLATAHGAGLVHGDVKPENILVGDGLVKVADFGLAHTSPTSATRGGTAAYMAPELSVASATIQSDQYAFAVSLYEAIAGELPMGGSLREAPGAVVRALERALSPDPAARFPSMTELLNAISPQPPRRRLGLWTLGALVVLAAAAASLRRGPNAEPCGAAEARLAAVWTPAAQAELPPTMVRALDDYGRRWEAMARSTCEATQRGEQSPAMLDLRASCLDRRLDEMQAFIAAAERTGKEPVAAAFALSPLEPCADRDRLAGVLPPPQAHRAAIGELRKRIDRARAEHRTTGSRAARDDIEKVIAEARTLGYPPVLGEALLVRGLLQGRAGQFAEADASYAESAEAAAAGHDDDTLTGVWAERAYVLGTDLARHGEGLAYVDAAEKLAVRAQSPALQRARIRLSAGAIFEHADRLGEARTAMEQAVQLFEEAHGGEHPSVADALRRLANLCVVQGDLTAARRYVERARTISTKALGPSQPETYDVLESLARISSRDRDLPRALAEYRELLDLQRAGGADDLAVATTMANIGAVLEHLGRGDEARAVLEEALPLIERTSGPDKELALFTLSALARVTTDPALARRRVEDMLARSIARFGPVHRMVGDALIDVGNLLRNQKDLAGGRPYFERALAVYGQSLGPTHPRVAVALFALGDTALGQRRYRDALGACLRARAIDEATLGADHPDLAYDLSCIGEARLGLGEARAATELLERAVELGKPASLGNADQAHASFALARALWASGGDRHRARALATAALPGILKIERPLVERWLAAHPAR